MQLHAVRPQDPKMLKDPALVDNAPPEFLEEFQESKMVQNRIAFSNNVPVAGASDTKYSVSSACCMLHVTSLFAGLAKNLGFLYA